jgi:transposase
VQLRLEKQPTVIQDNSWQAQVRRCKRYRRPIARGKHAHQVVVAMARELVGCRWAMAKEVPVTL